MEIRHRPLMPAEVEALDQKPVFIVFRYMDGSKAGWWAIVNAKEGRITGDELHSRLEYPGCYGRHYCAFDHEVDLDDVHFEANGIIYQVPDTHRRYGKLVRDKVPNAIAECGDIPIARTLTPEEYKAALQEKLCEEAEEFWESYSLEEVADILEVVRAMTHCFTKYQFSDALEAMQKKAEGRGCFARRTFLEDVVGEDANWFYEVGSITPEILGSGSTHSNVINTKDAGKAFQYYRHRNYLKRTCRTSGGRRITQEYDPFKNAWVTV